MEIKGADRLTLIPDEYLFNALDTAKKKKEAEGVKVISLTVGDPDRPVPNYIINALKQASDNPANLHYPDYDGLPVFRNAVAYWYKKNFNVELDPNGEVLSCIGSKRAVADLSLAFVNPGEVVLMPNPCYTAYIPGVSLAGGEVYFMPVVEENNFLPELDKIPEDICKRAKLMLLNFPGNPTAALAPLSYFEKVVAFAKKHDIIVAHDCPYSEAIYDGERQPSFLEAAGAKDIGIEFHSTSKVFNMSGWRCAYAVGNRSVLKYLGKMRSNVDMGIFEPIQHAAVAALTGSMDFTRETSNMYKERRDVLCEGLNRLGWNVRIPKGTFFIWTKVPVKGVSSADFVVQLMEKAGVQITPGTGFGKLGEGYIRIALTRDTEVMREVVSRIEKAGFVY